jgi:hypothetical protein
MELHLSEESLWARALAARLRVLQANFADDDPATRQEYIVEEIERALKGTVPEKRKALLAALSDRFPSFQVAVVTRDSQAPSPVSIPAAPEDLLDSLIKALPGLSNEQRAEFAAKLKAAGLTALAEPSGANLEAPPELVKRLGLTADQTLNPPRSGKALALLMDMVLTMDQLVWTLWKQIAPKSTVRREADLIKLSGQYLTGSQEVSTAQVTQALERTRKMVAGLLGAVGRAGATFARERTRLFDPNAIRADAQAEKKWNESMEFACWRKYEQLCKEYGAEPMIEKSIQEAVAKAAENLIMGRPQT